MKKQKTNFFSRYKYDFIVGGVILLISLFIFLAKDSFNIFSDRETFQQFVSGFGVWGPLIILMAVILEVIIAPIPGFIIAITAGFLFGPIEGAIYTYVGNVIGTMIVFWFSRKFGKQVVKRVFKKTSLDKYEKVIARHENYLLFFYFLPILPIDIITATFGFSNIKTKKFLKVILFGFIFYSVIVTNFGDYLAKLFFSMS